MTILQTVFDLATTEQSLVSYGVLGVFSLLMIMIIRYQDKTNKAQQENVLSTYKAVNDSFKSELNDLKKEKELVYTDFLNHLKNTEDKLLTIISDNTNAFKLLVNSNDLTAKAILSLSDMIHERDNTAKELNENMIKILNK